MKNHDYRVFKNDILKYVQIILTTQNLDFSSMSIKEAWSKYMDRIGYTFQEGNNDEILIHTKNSIKVLLHKNIIMIIVNNRDYCNREHFRPELELIFTGLQEIGVKKIDTILCNKCNQIEFLKSKVEKLELDKEKVEELIFSEEHLSHKGATYTKKINNIDVFVKQEYVDQSESILYNLYIMSMEEVNKDIHNIYVDIKNMHEILFVTFVDSISDYLYDLMLEM